MKHIHRAPYFIRSSRAVGCGIKLVLAYHLRDGENSVRDAQLTGLVKHNSFILRGVDITMSWVDRQSGDDGALTAAWSVTCGSIAAVIALATGNVPLAVFALSVTATDLVRRLAYRVMNPEPSSYPHRRSRVDGTH